MPNIVGIRFKKGGKIYSFDDAGIPLQVDDQVVVNTDNGLAIGIVASAARNMEGDQVPADLKKVDRKATEEDQYTREENQKLEQEAHAYCLQKIREKELPMKLIDVECLFDRSKIVFNFTADNRVDFRELVKSLVQKFRSRIELRQIGARQEARIVGGLAVCGRECCCGSWLNNLDRVSVKMAKEQSTSLNPEKISGLCGRLMCCLAFEYDTYMDLKKNMPKCGKTIQLAEGRGKVIRQNILKGDISVALENGEEISVNIKDKDRKDFHG
ncbi:MAG: stage 0 sporulation family protein [Smithellaceae bacterium]|nr:stage 0 sporulation family protein [Smithellaceae bacterium]